jgi:tetratricopeptide (TPR) repeat protein
MLASSALRRSSSSAVFVAPTSRELVRAYYEAAPDFGSPRLQFVSGHLPSVAMRRPPIWLVGVLAVIAGLAVGRFITYEPKHTATPPAALPGVSTAASLESQVTALEAAVAADPNDASSWKRLGSAYVGRAAEVGDADFYALATKAFDKASALTPDDPAIVVGRGALALALHDFPSAEALGQQAVKALPKNADALGVLVDAQVELGQYASAAATLQSMLDARPGLPALARTSYLRELNGDLEGATEAMRNAVVAGASSPFDVATVTALLGDLQRNAGALDEAMASYEEALRQSPGLLLAELGRARVIAARGDLPGATAIVQPVVDRHTATAALFLLADLQAGSGDVAGEANTVEVVRAAATLQQAAGQVVDLEMALFEADIARDPARAMAFARRAYDARPDNVFTADAMAWALFRSGDAAAALPFAQQAVRLNTANPLLQYHAAEVFAAAGDLEQARVHLQVTLAAGPAFSVRYAVAATDLAARLGLSASSGS